MVASVVAALTGCAAPEAAPETGDLPTSYALACPPGETREVAPGVCATVLSDEGTLQEPAIARHPTRPDVMAIGANGGRAAAGAPPDALPLAVFVTEDAGATWRRAAAPRPVATGHVVQLQGDPALAFDADGRLHITGLLQKYPDPADLDPARPFAVLAAIDVFHASSGDLGATWDGPTMLTDDGDNDRNWIAVGPDGALWATWHVCCVRTEAAWSTDNGATWTDAEDIEGCYTGSPVTWVDGAPWVACAEGTPQELAGIALWRYDGGTGAASKVGLIEGMTCIAPRILSPPDGALLVTCYGGLAARSVDGGRTWPQRWYLPELATLDEGWENEVVYWSEVDPHGAVHVQLAEYHAREQRGYAEGREHRALWMAWDPATGRVLGEARLTPEGAESGAGGAGSYVAPLGDDWWGIVFAGDRGTMVWSHAGDVYVTMIVPGVP